MNRVQPRSVGFALAVFLGAWHAAVHSDRTRIDHRGAIGYVSGWFIGFVWNYVALRPAGGWQLEQHEPRHAH